MYLFAKSWTPPCKDAVDANDSGAIDIADPIATLSYLFAHGQIPDPGPLTCGTDPTADAAAVGGDLGCEAHAACANP